MLSAATSTEIEVATFPLVLDYGVKTCRTCKESLPLASFHASTRSADGLQNACRECQNEWRRRHLAQKRAAIRAALPTALGTTKRCPRCGEVRGRDDFHRNRSNSDGLQAYCKRCSKQVQREYEARNADAVAIRKAERAKLPRADGTKTCTKCGETKPRISFYALRNTKDGRATYCMECQKAQSREWRAANRERVRQRNADYAAANPGVKRRNHRQYWLKLYGLDPAAYQDLLASQGGVCAICRAPERILDARTGEPRRLSVDHCHTTGRVRGLLCGHCNRGIGQFEDSPERLDSASAYLKSHIE